MRQVCRASVDEMCVMYSVLFMSYRRVRCQHVHSGVNYHAAFIRIRSESQPHQLRSVTPCLSGEAVEVQDTTQLNSTRPVTALL